METRTATAVRLNAGDKVPDWLLSVEPIGPHSQPGEITLFVPVDIVETDTAYWLFPVLPGQHMAIMECSGTYNQIVAPGKDVRVAVGTIAVVRHEYMVGRYYNVSKDAAAPLFDSNGQPRVLDPANGDTVRLENHLLREKQMRALAEQQVKKSRWSRLAESLVAALAALGGTVILMLVVIWVLTLLGR